MSSPIVAGRRLARSRVAGALAALTSLGFVAFAAQSCTGDSTEASVRSLERTGRVAYICLGAPGSDAALRYLAECNGDIYDTPQTFGSDDAGAHVYAVVTLETRGEVAVVDLSTDESNVLDQDPSTPGANPLPVGAQPTDIVATPMGTAVFVSSADPTRPAVYALSGDLLRPCDVDSDRCDKAPPTLSSWPACTLPSVPGRMVMVADPLAKSGAVRDGCDGPLKSIDGDTPAFGDIDREGLGRQKLFVTLPREGRIVVIDAQHLLASDPGSVDACAIEREIPLSTSVPVVPAEPVIPDGPACVVPEKAEPRPAGEADRSIPAGVALDMPVGGEQGQTGGKLYVADIGAPIIHVIDLNDTCNPVEAAPLLPTSAEDPSRVVLTDRVAVSGLTPSERRYVYATDVEDKSVMAFDVSATSASPTPLSTPHPELNPFQPADRVRFASAPVDLTILQRDVPQMNGVGISPIGTLCDPNPKADVCSTDSTDCDLGTLYRTSSDFETGAGPLTLRGDFAMVALASGQIAVIDIEDFDAPCRGPKDRDSALGCDTTGTGLITTDEPSCNTVLPHAPRSNYYLLTNDDVGRHRPGIQTFPVLSLEDGTVVSDGPVMRVPQGPAASQVLAVGGDVVAVDPTTGAVVDDEGARNTLLLNLQNPRVHQADQTWSAVYEGALPGFDGHVGDLDYPGHTFTDPTATFCQRGIQPENAVRESLAAEGLEGSELDETAARYADRLHVAEPLAASDDPYWQNGACTYAACRAAFGDAEVPTVSRDIRVVEAYEDRLELAPPDGLDEAFFECCFPTLVDYEVRAGDEWLIVGSASGLNHNVIADPETGMCRPSCDPRLSLENARARYVVGDQTTVVKADDPAHFHNALFDFAIVVPDRAKLERDMAFRWVTQASFVALRAELTNDSRSSVQAQSLTYLEAMDEVVITDGALEGLILLPGSLSGDTRQFY